MVKYVEVIRGLNLGGAETLLVSRLRYALQSGTFDARDVVVVNTRPDLDWYLEALRDLGVQVIGVRARSQLRKYREVRRILRVLAPSFVIFHSPLETFWLKFVRMWGGAENTTFVEVAHSTVYRSVYQVLGRALNCWFDRCVAVSDDVAQSPSAAGFHDVEVVTAGADREAFRRWIIENPSAPIAFRRRVALQDDTCLLVAVGSLIKLKGHAALIEAMMHLPPTVSLVLVGDGVERLALEKLVHERGLNDRVRFAGRQANGWRWTAVADLVVHPSVYEGLPVALVEAAVLGTPFLATDVGGVSQIVSSHPHSWLAVSADSTQLASSIEHALRASVQNHAPIFADRAIHPSPWDMAHHVKTFYAAVDSTRRASRRRQSAGQWQ